MKEFSIQPELQIPDMFINRHCVHDILSEYPNLHGPDLLKQLTPERVFDTKYYHILELMQRGTIEISGKFISSISQRDIGRILQLSRRVQERASLRLKKEGYIESAYPKLLLTEKALQLLHLTQEKSRLLLPMNQVLEQGLSIDAMLMQPVIYSCVIKDASDYDMVYQTITDTAFVKEAFRHLFFQTYQCQILNYAFRNTRETKKDGFTCSQLLCNQQMLSEELGFSETHTRRFIFELMDAGYLTKSGQRNFYLTPKAQQLKNLYFTECKPMFLNQLLTEKFQIDELFMNDTPINDMFVDEKFLEETIYDRDFLKKMFQDEDFTTRYYQILNVMYEQAITTDGGTYFFDSLHTIALKLNLHRHQVDYIFRHLIDAGYLKKADKMKWELTKNALQVMRLTHGE